MRARALREAEGLLSGYAAGELDVDPDDGLIYDLLGDIKRVVVEAGRDWMHSEEIVTGLAGLRPGHYRGWSAEVLAKNLTPLGVGTKPLYRTGPDGVRTNRRGVELRQLVEAIAARNGATVTRLPVTGPPATRSTGA